MAELRAVIVPHVRKTSFSMVYFSYRSYTAMDRILKGIMKYRKCHREGMVKQFQQVRDHPEVCSYNAKKKSHDDSFDTEIYTQEPLSRCHAESTCVLLISISRQVFVSRSSKTNRQLCLFYVFILIRLFNNITHFKCPVL